MQIINMDGCPYSDRNGTYGGRGGDKDGIIYDGGYWIIKYPKAMYVRKDRHSSSAYTTSPVSEYAGSHIFRILGIPAQDTMLCFRQGKIAAACRDFCRHKGNLMEMRTIRNTGIELFSEEEQAEFMAPQSGNQVNLKELLLHYERNPLLCNIPGIIEHFWETAVVDILIGNESRSNEDRGLLFDEDTKTYSIAPVYGNGSSFSAGSETPYVLDSHRLSAKEFLCLPDEGLRNALGKMLPLVKEHEQQIEDIINDISVSYQGITVCSPDQKQFMIEGMRIRLKNLLEPALGRAISRKQEERRTPRAAGKEAQER